MNTDLAWAAGFFEGEGSVTGEGADVNAAEAMLARLRAGEHPTRESIINAFFDSAAELRRKDDAMKGVLIAFGRTAMDPDGEQAAALIALDAALKGEAAHDPSSNLRGVQ